jgi:hypothetical protein
MRLGDRFLVRSDAEGRETYGVVIAIRPGEIDLLCPGDEIVPVPYRHEDLTAAVPQQRIRRGFRVMA